MAIAKPVHEIIGYDKGEYASLSADARSGLLESFVVSKQQEADRRRQVVGDRAIILGIAFVTAIGFGGNFFVDNPDAVTGRDILEMIQPD